MFSTRIHWFAALAAVIGLAAHNAVIQPWTLDDAYISFRYAEHFAQGEGFVYNPGERVEGYTNFLWVLLLGLGRLLGADVVLLSKVLGVLLGVGTLALLASAHRFVPFADRSASAVAAILVGSSGVFTGWVMSGMEVTMAGFWVLLALLLHLRARATAPAPRLVTAEAACCALATMTRPEFALLFLVLFADHLVDGLRNRSGAFLRHGIVFSAIYVPYFAWRWWYFGWLFPNTFYAKVGSTWEQVQRGTDYTIAFAEPAAAMLLAILLGIALWRYRRAAVLPVWLVLHAAYVTGVGGDVFPMFRFYAPAIPVAGLAAAIALAAAVRRPAILIALLGVFVAFQVFETKRNPPAPRKLLHARVDTVGRALGLWLRDYAPPGSLIAVNAAGALPYYSRLPTIDMLGLTDQHIAHRPMERLGGGKAGHEKGDGAYVLSRRPDFIQLGSTRGSGLPVFPSDAEIYRSRDFKEWYVFREHEIPNAGKLRLYERLEEPRSEAEWEEERRRIREERSRRRRPAR